MKTITAATYTFSKDNPPAAHADPGEIIAFIANDGFDGQVKAENRTGLDVDFDHTNPATGPLFVNGAEPGDAIGVEILDIEVAERGIIGSITDLGPLYKMAGGVVRFVEVRDGFVYFNDIKWPAEPMIGVIGSAPAGEPIPTGHASANGGNMDSRLNRKGSTVWLPVNVPGGLIGIGDLHASMADGEVIGTGIEIAGTVVARIKLAKGADLRWVVTETPDAWYVNTNADTCDEAIEHGYMEMHRLLKRAYGWSDTVTALYMSATGYLASNQACLVSGAGGNTFRVGTPKNPDKPGLI